jgi:hypothetical protein
MAALWNPAVNSVSITFSIQGQVSGKHLKKIIVG